MTRVAARSPEAHNVRPGLGLLHQPYLAGVFEGSSSGFARREWVEAASGALQGLEPSADPLTAGVKRRWRVVVAPGKVRVASTVTESEGGLGREARRGIIGGWSSKSRLRMVEAMASLDWGPVVDSEAGWRPAMVTLTLPGGDDWENGWVQYAPTGEAFKVLMAKFWRRWERRWSTWDCGACGTATTTARGRGVKGKRRCASCGLVAKGSCTYTRRPFRGVWKLEFQRRGAPHLHLYSAVPVGPEFRAWLSQAWYEIVGSGDARHLAAGTGVDWGEGIRASDPRRLAVYFLKRTTGHNLGRDKEYQHVVPLAWQGLCCPRGARCRECDLDQGPGRFWGYKGLVKAEVQVELTEAQFLALRRLLRRYTKAEGRPVRSLASGRGFGGLVLVNDAPSLVAQASRWDALALEAQPDRWLNRETGEVHDWHPSFSVAGRHKAAVGLVEADEHPAYTGTGIEDGTLLAEDVLLRQFRREAAQERWRDDLRASAKWPGRGTQDTARHPARSSRPDQDSEYGERWRLPF